LENKVTLGKYHPQDGRADAALTSAIQGHYVVMLQRQQAASDATRGRIEMLEKLMEMDPGSADEYRQQVVTILKDSVATAADDVLVSQAGTELASGLGAFKQHGHTLATTESVNALKGDLEVQDAEARASRHKEPKAKAKLDEVDITDSDHDDNGNADGDGSSPQ
jgi:hypothetical protein